MRLGSGLLREAHIWPPQSRRRMSAMKNRGVRRSWLGARGQGPQRCEGRLCALRKKSLIVPIKEAGAILGK